MFTLLVGVLYVAINIVLSLYDMGYWFSSAVGFSGVLFAMAVDEASLSPFPTRSVFGLFSVPTRVYPWVLMLVLQFIMPGASLVGHLAGIIVGFVHTWGWLSWAIPTLPTLRRIEAWPVMTRLVRTGPYKLVPAAPVVRGSATFAAFLADTATFLRCVAKPVMDCYAHYRGRGGGGGGLAGRMEGGSAAGGAASPSSRNFGGGAVGGGPSARMAAAAASAAHVTSAAQTEASAEDADLEAAIAASLADDGAVAAARTAGPFGRDGSEPKQSAASSAPPESTPQSSQRSEAAARAAAAALSRLAARGFAVGAPGSARQPMSTAAAVVPQRDESDAASAASVLEGDTPTASPGSTRGRGPAAYAALQTSDSDP